MQPLIAYFAKSIVASAILYLYYVLVLRHTRLHQFSRFFILAALTFCMLLPFVRFNLFSMPASNATSAIKMLQIVTVPGGDEVVGASTRSTFSMPSLLEVLYLMPGLIILTLTIIRVAWIYRAGAKYPVKQEDGYQLVQTQLSNAPFSFFNTVFWNVNIDIYSEHGSQILAHELVHVRGHHTIDKLFAQLAVALCWINPFFWLFQRELSLVHEYIADAGSIPANDTGSFAQMMLQAHFKQAFPNIVHPFFSSSIKKRLTMISNTKSLSLARLRKYLVLPIALIPLVLFSFRIAEKKVVAKATHKMHLMVDPGHGGGDVGAINDAGLKEKDLNLKICKKLQELAGAYNIDVSLTREDDNYIALYQRVAMAKTADADVFLSVHVNRRGPGNSYDNDYSIYVSARDNAKIKDSKLLASAIYNRFTAMRLDAGINAKSLFVLRENEVPAVLLECGDINNPGEMHTLQDETALEDLCKNVLEAVAEYGNARK